MEQWRKVFLVCVPVYAVCELFFLAFLSTSLQPWDRLSGGQEKGAIEDEDIKENVACMKEEKEVEA